MGAWLKVNGEGIYNSKPVRPYASGNIYLTQSKVGANVYAFYLGETEEVVLPAEVTIEGYKPSAKSRVSLLGYKGNLKGRQEGKKFVISVPAALQHKVIGKHGVTFRIVS
jgi:alpha-L-fucosidase